MRSNSPDNIVFIQFNFQTPFDLKMLMDLINLIELSLFYVRTTLDSNPN